MENNNEQIMKVKEFINKHPDLLIEFKRIKEALKVTLSIEYSLKLNVTQDCPTCGDGDYLVLNVCSSEWTEEQIELLDNVSETSYKKFAGLLLVTTLHLKER